MLIFGEWMVSWVCRLSAQFYLTTHDLFFSWFGGNETVCYHMDGFMYSALNLGSLQNCQNVQDQTL